ncbi:MAG: M23 family metallopeptidase [Flavobacteriales bacterium]
MKSMLSILLVLINTTHSKSIDYNPREKSLVVKIIKSGDHRKIKRLKKLVNVKKYRKEFQYLPDLVPIHPQKIKRISSFYGYRKHPIKKVKHFHNGIDFSARKGTPVYASSSGIINLIKRSHKGYGKQIELSNTFGYKTKYAHLSKIIVSSGQKITKGQKIGYVGSTGSSTGPHLHFEIFKNGKRVDPSKFIINP